MWGGGVCQAQRWYLCDLRGIIFTFPLHPEFLQKASEHFVSLTYFNGKRQNAARVTHQKHSPLIFQSTFKMKHFPNHRLINSFIGVPPAEWRCSLCVSCYFSVSLFVSALLGDVCECFHGNVDNFHLLNGFKPRQSCKSTGRRLSHSALIIYFIRLSLTL